MGPARLKGSRIAPRQAPGPLDHQARPPTNSPLPGSCLSSRVDWIVGQLIARSLCFRWQTDIRAGTVSFPAFRLGVLLAHRRTLGGRIIPRLAWGWLVRSRPLPIDRDRAYISSGWASGVGAGVLRFRLIDRTPIVKPGWIDIRERVIPRVSVSVVTARIGRIGNVGIR